MANRRKPLVGIIMGSDSDLAVMKDAEEILKLFDIPYELDIVSAHRTPQKMFKYAESAHRRGLKVIIAGAGGAAHLPGMVASITPLPVIGVPIKVTALQGLDSLLSIVQMPAGVPVATVAIDNAKNAAILAAQIIGTSDEKVMQKVVEYKKSLFKTVQEKSKKTKRAYI
ncbi:MAG: 5-(carboxyamino)imidazole ribonucleotide mutase [Candidatus Calescibacterium sp.]|nr:5-(carboxyamino)imidazole ribonucleotide mutase [Candidatus Calescibacterium sp.]MCX7734508.1 5-(carboxyamino)imidazole ribonucleotide mutase [bacterium]MDW8087667.1 5-(carboxyamino)imidazole ribonucleotide mutase [Candidatus Calescibacterium sp.]